MAFIKCFKSNCFQNFNDRCMILHHACKGEKCPFYKTKEENDRDRQAAYERLRKLGRSDLISLYCVKPADEYIF